MSLRGKIGTSGGLPPKVNRGREPRARASRMRRSRLGIVVCVDDSARADGLQPVKAADVTGAFPGAVEVSVLESRYGLCGGAACTTAFRPGHSSGRQIHFA